MRTIYISINKYFLLIVIALSLSVPSLYGQDTIKQLEPRILTLNRYLQWVEAYHPIAKQIPLIRQEARSKLQKAKGNFDPKLSTTYDDKYFSGSNYWKRFESELKVPTRIGGTELKAGFVDNSGVFLNGDEKLPDQGQFILGVSVPLGRGLITDEHRTSIRQAELMLDLAEIEQQLMLNELFFDATMAYWSWTANYASLLAFEEAAMRAKELFDGIKASFLAGDYAGIDTVDALSQFQNLTIMRNEAAINYMKAGLKLSNFLWSEDEQPLQVDERARPEALDAFLVEFLIDPDSIDQVLAQIDRHPELLKIENKLARLEMERRLKANNLLPDFRLNGNLLSADNAFVGEVPVSDLDFRNNYKWGFEVNIPLFYRKERADLALAKIKIRDTELKQQQKGIELRNKVTMYQQQSEQLIAQVNLSEDAVTNYERLLEAEEIRLRAGESNLFLVNSRANKLIESQQKLIALRKKHFESQSTLVWVSGMLVRDL